MKRLYFFYFPLCFKFLFLISSLLNAQTPQTLTQVVRGKVIDQDSKMPIIGANVVIVNSQPILGTSTNINGNFHLKEVPIGRVDLRITAVGYKESYLPNIQVGSVKEVVLTVELLESITQMETVVVNGKENKMEVLNEMALTSGRGFTVKETSRYAGTFNDPARMASAFAGVTGNAEGKNDIVVRGNSPMGILWRIEGIEIPDPNHFSTEGSTGGPVSALNTQVLANSDFFSGAFAPEYGNAFSGVFDIKLRKGNNEKREYALGVSTLGVNLSAEGPFKTAGKASYLANYRFSSLKLLDKAGLLPFEGVPRYQDAAFKLHLPAGQLGNFSVFGIGGLSSIHTIEKSEQDKLLSDSDVRNGFGVLGVQNFYSLNKNNYFVSTLALTTNQNSRNSAVRIIDIMKVKYQEQMEKVSGRFKIAFNTKFNARNKLENGLIYTKHYYSFHAQNRNPKLDTLVTQLDKQGNSGLMQAYSSWKHRFSEELTMVSGVHFMQLMLNNSYSIEPRLGLKWQFTSDQSINGGFGMHSQMNNLLTYFVILNKDGKEISPNKELKLKRAFHYVIGYENKLSDNLHLKAELYYQALDQLPVENNPNSLSAAINNSEGYRAIDQVSKGTGTNYGLELTLERFFAEGFYYMLTTSLYEAKFSPLNGKVYNSTFNRNYAANLLAGKEIELNQNDQNTQTLTFNFKMTLLGPRRYNPIDKEASIKHGTTIVDLSNPYSTKGDEIFQASISFDYRLDMTKATHSFKLDIQNFTNHQAVTKEYFDAYNNEIRQGRQLGVVPMVMYTLAF